MKINKINIAKINNAEELLEFISINRYDEGIGFLESEEFMQLPEWTKDIIYILDFETEYEMEGLFTYLENSTGHYLAEVTQSFIRSDNKDIAEILTELRTLLEDFGVTPDRIRENSTNSETELYDISSFAESNQQILEDNPEFTEMIENIDEKLGKIIDQKEFWNKLQEYVQREIDK